MGDHESISALAKTIQTSSEPWTVISHFRKDTDIITSDIVTKAIANRIDDILAAIKDVSTGAIYEISFIRKILPVDRLLTTIVESIEFSNSPWEFTQVIEDSLPDLLFNQEIQDVVEKRADYIAYVIELAGKAGDYSDPCASDIIYSLIGFPQISFNHNIQKAVAVAVLCSESPSQLVGLIRAVPRLSSVDIVRSAIASKTKEIAAEILQTSEKYEDVISRFVDFDLLIKRKEIQDAIHEALRIEKQPRRVLQAFIEKDLFPEWINMDLLVDVVAKSIRELPTPWRMITDFGSIHDVISHPSVKDAINERLPEIAHAIERLNTMALSAISDANIIDTPEIQKAIAKAIRNEKDVENVFFRLGQYNLCTRMTLTESVQDAFQTRLIDLVEVIRSSNFPWSIIQNCWKCNLRGPQLIDAINTRLEYIVNAITSSERPYDIIRAIGNVSPLTSKREIQEAIVVALSTSSESNQVIYAIGESQNLRSIETIQEAITRVIQQSSDLLPYIHYNRMDGFYDVEIVRAALEKRISEGRIEDIINIVITYSYTISELLNRYPNLTSEILKAISKVVQSSSSPLQIILGIHRIKELIMNPKIRDLIVKSVSRIVVQIKRILLGGATSIDGYHPSKSRLLETYDDWVKVLFDKIRDVPLLIERSEIKELITEY